MKRTIERSAQVVKDEQLPAGALSAAAVQEMERLMDTKGATPDLAAQALGRR